MARATFGGTAADTVARRVKVLGHDVDDYEAATLTVWSAQTGGTQYTDLLVNGAASNSVPVDSTGQVPEFQGPDGVTIVWVSAGGARVKMLPAEGPTDTSVAGYVNDSASATRAATDAKYGRGAVDPRAFGATYNGTTDDAAAIQAALDTGLDVVIGQANGGAALNVKVGSTLRLVYAHKGQRLTTIGARLLPSFLGDVIQVDGDFQHVRVSIAGDLQPGSGDFSEVAAIRIGKNSTGTVGSPGNWPFQVSLAGSEVRSFKGNGVIWENGPMVDFTQVYISDVTYDGFRAGGVSGMWDANHGLFIGTHVVRAGRYGYYLKRRVTEANEYEDTRFNKFVEAKAYDCGVKDGTTHVTTSGANYRIETGSNYGSIFTELGLLNLTANAKGNRLEVEPFNALMPAGTGAGQSPYGNTDAGQGNRIEGFSPWEYYETVKARFNKIEVNARYSGVRSITQTGAGTFADQITENGADSTINYDPESGFTRIDQFNGQLGLPGTTDRATLALTHTGILTVPASTTVPANGSWTSAALATGVSQYGNGFATMFSGSADLLITMFVNASFEARVVVRNLTGAGIDISGKYIRWTQLNYRL